MELSEDHIFLNIEARNKKNALKNIAEFAEQAGVVTSKKAYFTGLWQREKEATTGFGNGFAIPHAKIKEVVKPAVFVVKFTDGLDWKALDDQFVHVAIALAVPEQEAGTEHLKLLSQISRRLIHDDFRDRLMNSTTKREIAALFQRA